MRNLLNKRAFAILLAVIMTLDGMSIAHVNASVLKTVKEAVLESSPPNGEESPSSNESHVSNGEGSPSNSESHVSSGEGSPSNSESHVSSGEGSPSNSESHVSSGEGTPSDSEKDPTPDGKKDLSDTSRCSITLSITECYYTQEEITPEVTVQYDSQTLQQDVDYQVSYENNIDIGTGTVTVHGIGDYKGDASTDFTIKVKTGASYTIGTYKYKITDAAQVSFAGIKGSNVKTVKIPKTVSIGGQSYKVTSIASQALYKKKITRVTIGANVQVIGKSAFESCTSLKEVELGKNVKTIGDRAFYKCSMMTAITLPPKVSSIGRQAFYNCKKLSNITIGSTKLTASNIGSKAFRGIYKKAVITVPKKKQKAYQTLLRSKGVGAKAKFII